MKSTFFKSLAILFILILTISCSVDSEENLEQLNALSSTQKSIEQQDLLINNQKSSGQTCGDPNIFITYNEFNFYYIYVEYEAGTTKEERQAIRAPYCSNMVSIIPCSVNPNVETWHVKGFCPAFWDCKPDILLPTDPDLRSSQFSNICISAPL